MKTSVIIRLVTAVIMIISGTAIYVVYRRDIIFFKFIPSSVLDAAGNSHTAGSCPGDFVTYSLPDGLWYAALLLIQSIFLDGSKTSGVLFLISAGLPFAWELLQIHPAVPGTFDVMDLSLYSVILILFIILKRLCHDQNT